MLKTAWQLFTYGEGGDAIVELEIRLKDSVQHDGLVLLTLAQLYVMAGQGETTLVPGEGPAADTGKWDLNKPRFLKRALQILEEARRVRPDDAFVEYLVADAIRAGGDLEKATEYLNTGKEKCSLLSSVEILQKYQDLLSAVAVQISMDSPVYPESAVLSSVRGEVVLDLLEQIAERYAKNDIYRNKQIYRELQLYSNSNL